MYLFKKIYYPFKLKSQFKKKIYLKLQDLARLYLKNNQCN